MKTRLHKISGLLLLAILGLNLTAIFLASCSLGSTIYLDPSNYIFDASTTPVGTLFNVTVKVNNVTDMGSWQVKMSFNDTIINVTRWYEPKWDPTYVFYGKTTFPIPGPVDVMYGPGWLGIGCALFPAPSPGGGFTGNGMLCIIGFNITSVPPQGQTYSCAFDITGSDTFWIKVGEAASTPFDNYQNGYYEIGAAPTPYDATVKAYCNTEGKEVNVTITKDGIPTGYNTSHTFTSLIGSHTFTVPTSDPSGHVFINWSTGETSRTITVTSGGTFTAYYEAAAPPPVGTRLYVDPPEIIDPTMLPSSTFHINITIANVAIMQICEFNLSYDSHVLGWMGISVLRVQGQVPRASADADGQAGYVWVKLNYTNPVTTSDPIPLVRIEFHVEALGATTLDLHDSELLDAVGNPINHTEGDGFFMSLIRDVAITGVVPSMNWAYVGWPVNITITAKNLGNVSETFDVKAYYDSSLIGELPVVGLLPNAQTNVTITWNTTGVPAGNYTIKGEAATVPYEFNTTNNVYVDGTVQILTVIRDVAITSVVPARSWVYQGFLVDINVTAANLGNLTETFDVKAYNDSTVIGTIHVTNLAPNTQITLTFTWNTSSARPCHNYTITGEATAVPYEFNTTNNVYVDGTIKVRILGDINGDGTVNMLDITMVINAFMSYPGHPLWDPAADINQDNSVNMLDLAWTIANFGKSCPP